MTPIASKIELMRKIGTICIYIFFIPMGFLIGLYLLLSLNIEVNIIWSAIGLLFTPLWVTSMGLLAAAVVLFAFVKTNQPKADSSKQ